MRVFLPSEHKSCLPIFLTNDIFTNKKNIFLHNHPKNTIFLFFHVFHILLFTFSNIKKAKTKSAHFFSKTVFWHPDKLPKKYFRAPTHYLYFLDQQKHDKTGEKTSKRRIFNATLDGFSTQKTPKSWTDFQLYSIYIYIWMRAIRTLPPLALRHCVTNWREWHRLSFLVVAWLLWQVSEDGTPVLGHRLVSVPS